MANAMTPFGDQAAMLRRWVWASYFDGLTDDELHWEPAPGTWGMRRKTDVRTDRTADEMPPGDYWVDVFRDPPDPVPFTTIAWRLAHLTLETWGWNTFLAGVPEQPAPPLRHDAAGALALWRSVLDRFVEVVSAMSEEQLGAKPGGFAGEATSAQVISHFTLEIAYHSAEVGTVRHLKRALAA